MIINLSEENIVHAGMIGLKREAHNIANGVKAKYGARFIGWNYALEGALGEFAVHLALGLPWSGSKVGDFKSRDVGNYQVRTTEKEEYGLRLNPSDRDDDIFICVVGSMGRYDIKGWIYGRDGKRQKYWRKFNTTSTREAFFVPIENLYSMDILPKKGG